jgi:hypothetical protein
MLIEGKFFIGAIAFSVAAVILIIMTYLPSLPGLALALFLGLPVIFLGTVDFCKKRKFRPQMLILTGIALVVIALIVAAVGGALVYVGATSPTGGQPGGEIQLRLDTASTDRDRAKQDELVATKAELDRVRHELEATKSSKAADAKPAYSSPSDFRRVSVVQMRILIRELSAAKADIPRVLLTYFPDPKGEALQYMGDFAEVINRAGIIAGQHGPQTPADSTQEGIFIYVPDMKNPPIAAVKISKALDAASITHKFAPLEPGRPPEFIFFVGPNPL